MKEYLEFWTHLFTFNATATRKQYWIPTILNSIFVAIYAATTNQNLYITDNIYNVHLSTNSLIFTLIIFLAWIANFTVRARRLHDINKSNWWILISIIPIIGSIWLFILMITDSKNSRWNKNQSEL